MKQHLERIALKLDARSLRERAIIFVLAATILIVLVNQLLLDPQYRAQKQLSERIRQEQTQTAAIQTQIRELALAQQNDPDQGSKDRLRQLQQDLGQVRSALGNMQQGLIAPEKMAGLLEDMLRRHGKLRLVSLNTLPASSLLPGQPASTAATAGQPGAGVYRHGVEIVVRGQYLDIMNYLAQLEAMPSQLFWSKARLSVDQQPESTLTLTIFTLSLDAKWMKL
ncbi:type II secretion system protein GspM [Noviherbaspirillum aridicola]|uniref:MSHA biogenesis protein MshJ n=1 Tax=Noviherbaspirillum aridicola TaxID=2849687 RepID=A0ABQ4Q6K2_9BURK|nr:type II secretion system protein GspM [Noviherbaspirillum aridicola]GIZ52435.1 hypothetical protein NCCP691_24490 [Noviherbaspirillum aridicola]